MSTDFDALLGTVKDLVRELKQIHSKMRKTRNAVAKELRKPLVEQVITNKTIIVSSKKQITPEFAEFVGMDETTCMTNEEAMAHVAKYVADNALISESEPTKIVLDRRLKILLGLNRYHEPNATYAFLAQHVDSLFMHPHP